MNKIGEELRICWDIFVEFSKLVCGPSSSVSIATDYRLEGPGSNPGGDRIFRPSSLLYNGYRVFPGGKVQLGHAADHSPPSSAMIMEE